MNPNTLMLIAAALGAVALFFPKLKPIIDKILPYIKTTKTDSVVITDDESKVPLDRFTKHEIAEHLMSLASQESDEESLRLIGAYGKHLYDLEIEKKLPKSQTKKGK